jgi:hypothetical protein
MPDENIKRAQGRQGDNVIYKVDPSRDAPFFVAYKIAFSSACRASEQLLRESRGQPVSGHSSSQLCVPAGGPLYPIEIIRVSLVSTAPTCALTQCERSARSPARFMKILSKLGFNLTLFNLYVNRQVQKYYKMVYQLLQKKRVCKKRKDENTRPKII